MIVIDTLERSPMPRARKDGPAAALPKSIPKQTTAPALELELKEVEVVVLNIAKAEGRKFLNEGQYTHMVDLIKRLVDIENPAEIADLRIEPIEGFLELKEKGGLLGKINARVYFTYLSTEREVVVVKAYKKEAEGKTPRHIVIMCEARIRKYRSGDDAIRKSRSIYRRESKTAADAATRN